jgi:Protein of unknown function (DUF2628)
MTVYTVLAPPIRDGEAVADPLGYVLVKEGFCWPALIIPELWLLFRRMWLVFLVYLAGVVAVVVADSIVGGNLPGAVLLLIRLFLALEGNNLRRWTLAGREYVPAGLAEGRNRDEADIRFFADWPDYVPAAAPTGEAVRPAPEAASPSPEHGGIVGLFPAPGGGS